MSPPNSDRLTKILFRVLGIALLILILVPLYRMVAPDGSGKIASDVVDAADVSRTLFLLGTLIVFAFGVLASRVLNPAAVHRRLTRVGELLRSPRPLVFAATLAILSAICTLIFSTTVLHGKPNLIDAMVQLTHARFVAAGHLAGPLDPLAEFWHLPNSIITKQGWVSQYPPGYVMLLALGLRLGVPQLIGPLMVALTVFFTCVAAEELLPDDRAVARVGGILLAFSPFALGLSGAFMNHAGAAAFIAVAVYSALRARRDRSSIWAIVSGAGVGAVFTIRPLTAVVAALVVAAVWLFRSPYGDHFGSGLVRSIGGATLGIIPFFVAIGAYNARFFGNPFRFGYAALVGPLVSPGFHRDPSGNLYGPLQAIGYTSSDLTTLSMYLLETPVPAVGIVALFLIFTRRFSYGTRVLVFWALLPVLANAFYWHHGIFMGPRMLNEWAPAWAVLTAVAAVGLVRSVPVERSLAGYSPRTAIAIALLLAWVAGIAYLGPQRLARYGGSWMASSRVEIPDTRRPALVFVHGGWPTRIAMRLTANGMRGDSLEAAMALNPTCDVHRFADWYSTRQKLQDRQAPTLNFDFATPVNLEKMAISTGDEIQYRKGEPLPRICLREIASDTLGIIDIAPLEWQGDLPGIGGDGAMIVRDLGPQANAKLVAKYPDRVPMIFFRPVREGSPRLVNYDDGIKALWPAG